jgi:hypothetical protein
MDGEYRLRKLRVDAGIAPDPQSVDRVAIDGGSQ